MIGRALTSRVIDALRKEDAEPVSSARLMVYWTFGLELEKYRATRDLAFTAYQAALSDPYALLQFRFQQSTEQMPARQLVSLAMQTGRRNEARRSLLELSRAGLPNSTLNEEAARLYRMLGLDAIGTSLVELGFAADAVPLYCEAQALSARVDVSRSPVLPRLPETPRLITEHLNGAIERLRDELAAVAGRAIAEALADGDDDAAQGGLNRFNRRSWSSVDRPDDDRPSAEPRHGIGAQPGRRLI